MERSKKSKKKIIFNLIFFILLILITFSIVFKEQDITQIWQIAINSKWHFILVAITAMGCYVLAEAMNIRRTLKVLNENINIFKCIKYTLIGFFFSSITPAASGGQPMEIYYMYKDEVKVAHSTLALLIQLFSMQVVTITAGIICAIINYEVLKTGLILLVIIGIVFNLAALTLLIIGIFSKKLSVVLIKFTGKVLKFFKIRNADTKIEKMENEIISYQESAEFIKRNSGIIIKSIITMIFQMLAYYSVPYWIYRALGFDTYTFWQIVALQATLFTTVSCIPSPGAVGVSEGGFFGIFRYVYAENVIGSAMILSRGISFYLLIIISLIITIINSLKEKKEVAKVD